MSGGRPRFYRLRLGRALHSFGDPVLSVPILGQPLERWQREAVEAAGGELAELREGQPVPPGAFSFEEDLYFTAEAVKEALSLSRNGKKLRFAVGRNAFNERFVLPDDPRQGAAWPRPSSLRFHGEGEESVAVLPQRTFAHVELVPGQIVKGGRYHYDQCDVILGRVASPFHLLHLNLAANLLKTVPIKKRLPAWFLERFVLPYSRNYYKGLRHLNRISRKARIHPTAVVEGCVIGDDVIVGAHCVLRLSEIGRGTRIEDQVSVRNSVLGEGNFIANGNLINVCLTYENVFLIHGPYQFSVFGRDVAAMAVINCDIRLDQKSIVIPTDRGLIDSGQPLLGLAYGHGAKVGGGNIIAPGRVIPNGLQIQPPEGIITSFEKRSPACLEAPPSTH